MSVSCCDETATLVVSLDKPNARPSPARKIGITTDKVPVEADC